MIGVVDDPCSPSLCSSLPLDTPAHWRSTMNAVKCSALDSARADPEPVEGSPSVTCANITKTSATPPLLIHIFSPDRRKLPSACFTAFVLAPSASEPDPD